MLIKQIITVKKSAALSKISVICGQFLQILKLKIDKRLHFRRDRLINQNYNYSGNYSF